MPKNILDLKKEAQELQEQMVQYIEQFEKFHADYTAWLASAPRIPVFGGGASKQTDNSSDNAEK